MATISRKGTNSKRVGQQSWVEWVCPLCLYVLHWSQSCTCEWTFEKAPKVLGIVEILATPEADCRATAV